MTSPTSSYTAVIRKRAARLKEARELGIKAPAVANGVALVRHAGASWIEAFPSSAHLERAIEAFAADLQDVPVAPRSSMPSVDRASQSLVRTWSSALISVATPPGTTGHAFAVDADGVAGSLLLRDGRLAHLAVSVAF